MKTKAGNLMIVFILLASTVYCESMQTSGRYVSELEKKQGLLNSIKEDTNTLATGFQKVSCSIVDSKAISPDRSNRKFELNGAELTKMLPVEMKTNLVGPAASMCSTLAPEQNPALKASDHPASAEDK